VQIKMENGANSLYSLRFVFDTLVPCSIALYFLCTEKLTEKMATKRFDLGLIGRSSSTYRFGPGLAQQFVLPDSDAFDISGFTEDQLMYRSHSSVSPLVIYLQHDEDEKRDSGQSSDPVSLSTFASFKKLPDGSYTIKFVKQKMRIGDCSYEFQEIYGLEGDDCTICMSNARTTTVFPCRHTCLCDECAQRLSDLHLQNGMDNGGNMSDTARCPICRGVVESLLQLPLVPRPRRGSASRSRRGSISGQQVDASSSSSSSSTSPSADAISASVSSSIADSSSVTAALTEPVSSSDVP